MIKSLMKSSLVCFWRWPFGHDWKSHSILYTGPIRTCRRCGKDDWGNGEQSVGG